MEFASESVKNVYERILPIIRELYGETIVADENAPVFYRAGESTNVEVFLSDLGNGEAMITAAATVNIGAELTVDMAKALLGYNMVSLCAFALNRHGHLVLTGSIIGSTADKPEVRTLINVVLNEADRMDNLIQQKFGGVTLLEEIIRLRSEATPPAPPQS